jgi:hypothetical protein
VDGAGGARFGGMRVWKEGEEGEADGQTFHGGMMSCARKNRQPPSVGCYEMRLPRWLGIGRKEKRRRARALQDLADFSGRVVRSTNFVFGHCGYAQARGDGRPPGWQLGWLAILRRVAKLRA